MSQKVSRKVVCSNPDAGKDLFSWNLNWRCLAYFSLLCTLLVNVTCWVNVYMCVCTLWQIAHWWKERIRLKKRIGRVNFQIKYFVKYFIDCFSSTQLISVCVSSCQKSKVTFHVSFLRLQQICFPFGSDFRFGFWSEIGGRCQFRSNRQLKRRRHRRRRWRLPTRRDLCVVASWLRSDWGPFGGAQDAGDCHRLYNNIGISSHQEPIP